MVVLQRDLEIRKAAAEQDEEARGKGKRARYPLGHFFDQQYQETHAEEIAAWKEVEAKRKRAGRTAAWAEKRAEGSNLAQRRAEAVSTDPQNPETLASIADELRGRNKLNV